MGKEKSTLFGVKGRKAKEDENSCSFQKMPLGNPPITGKDDQFAQVYVGGRKPRSTFLGVQAFRCFGKNFQRGAKRRQEYKSPVHSRALAKDGKTFGFVDVDDFFLFGCFFIP